MVSSRQHHFFKFGRFHSVQDTFLIVLFVTLVTLGNLGIGVWEVCRHNGGEAHFFLSGDPCSGLHVEEAGHHHRNSHYEASHHCGGDLHEDHHEPCDHEVFSMDHDWSVSGSRIALPNPSHTHIQSALMAAFLDTPYPKRFDSPYGFPRAPQESEECNQFVRTIRLLI